MLERRESSRLSSRLKTVSLITAGWGLWYAMYRAYYGFGGTVGMFGTPSSSADLSAPIAAFRCVFSPDVGRKHTCTKRRGTRQASSNLAFTR